MYQISDVNENDYKEILQIEKQLFEYPWNIKDLSKFAELEYFRIWKIELNEIIGYVLFFDIKNEIEIIKIGVTKDHQRKNCGSFFINKMKKKGAQNIFLEVSSANMEAINFYYKNGFKKTGIRKSYYQVKDETRIDALTLCLKIE
jgi:ribosomal-protein-alanine N-acetyltransferase